MCVRAPLGSKAQRRLIESEGKKTEMAIQKRESREGGRTVLFAENHLLKEI